MTTATIAVKVNGEVEVYAPQSDLADIKRRYQDVENAQIVPVGRRTFGIDCRRCYVRAFTVRGGKWTTTAGR